MGDSGTLRVGWVKLGKIWWPGKVVEADERTDVIKLDVETRLKRRTTVKADQVNVVQFFNEDAYEITFHPNEILLDVDEEKKHDLVKRAISQMKASSLSDNRTKFKADVLHAEKLLNPSADLSIITKLLDGEPLEPKKPVGVSKYSDIFPSPKPEKVAPITPTSATKGKAGAKFNFPSSRIISSASSKPLSKISPLPNDPSKKYTCPKCSFSADRVNVITTHTKFCKGPPTPQQRKVATPAKDPVTPSPSKQAKAITPSSTSSPSTPARRPGRPPKKSIPTPSTEGSPQKPASIPPSPPKAAASPKKRGRRSKRDKALSDKQKAEILQDWNDSSSEENDTDDELAPMMPPTKPPELFLFGSEKNKKRKADNAVEVAEGGGEGDTNASTAGGSNEDQPPVLKKPRTDKELSDAFDSLLKTTQMAMPTWSGKDEEMEEDEQHMSDIEEDAHIVMKKSDAVEASTETVPESEEKPSEKTEEKEPFPEKELPELTPFPKKASPKKSSTSEENQKKADDTASSETVPDKKEDESKTMSEGKEEVTTRASRRRASSSREKETDKKVETPVPVSKIVKSKRLIELPKRESPRTRGSSRRIEEASTTSVSEENKEQETPKQPQSSTKSKRQSKVEVTKPEPKKVEEAVPEDKKPAPSANTTTPVTTEEKVPLVQSVTETAKKVVEAKKSVPQSPTKLSPTSPATSPPASATVSSPTKKVTSVATVKATAASPPLTTKVTPTITSPPVTKPVVASTTPPPPVVNAVKTSPPPLITAKSPQKKAEEKKVVAAPAPTVTTAAVIPTAKVTASPISSPTKVQTQQQPPPQKKPTAAVRPLVDSKEVTRELPPPTTVKDGKRTSTAVTVVAPPQSSPKDQTQAQTTVGQTTIVTQQQQQADGDESEKKSPALVTQRVVHLVPVENQDGTITYMLLSLENGTENSVVLEQDGDQSNAVLRVDRVEALATGEGSNPPMNPDEVEGIFLDKNVESANQIVSALQQVTHCDTQGTATATSVMDTTTAYVTLAMDAIGAGVGIAASGSDTVTPTGVVQPLEGISAAQEGNGEQQQVYYMTEDGSLIDPQSLNGLTLEQIQQYLNQ